MNYLILLFTLSISTLTVAADLTEDFYKQYNNNSQLNSQELKSLKNTKIIFIPGILAETFQEDPRSVLNLSFLTKEYFGTQVAYLRNSYRLDVTRLKTSSKTLERTKLNILNSLSLAKKEKKNVIFIAHSLGGLALTEVLLQQGDYKSIQGVLYLQTPFWGSPIAKVYDNNTYYIKKLLKPLLPFFNTSEEIITYLRPDIRYYFMEKHEKKISKLNSHFPIISVVTSANNSFSFFRPAINIMEYGCLSVFRKKCITSTIYNGVKDQSDGMVPVSSGHYPNSNYLVLHGVDHGETVVNLGAKNINRKKMIEIFLHLLNKKASLSEGLEFIQN